MSSSGSQAWSGESAARATAYRELARRAHELGAEPAALLAPQATGARRRLGVTELDARFPFALGGAWRQTWERALLELASLYVTRNRKILGEAAYDRMMLGQEAIAPALPPRMLEAPTSISREILRQVMSRSGEILPGLDAGVLVAWWGSQGRGRPLLTEWSRLMARAATEMASTKGAEDTVVLIHWMARFGFALVPRVVSQHGLEGPAAQETQTALAVGLHLSHQVVLANTEEKMGRALASREGALSRWRALVAPELAFQAASSRLGHAHFHPFSGDPTPLIRDVLGRVAALGEEQALGELEQTLARSSELKSVALQRITRDRLLRLCNRALACGHDPGGAHLHAALLELRRHPEKILPLVDDRKARAEWSRQLESGASGLTASAAQEAVLDLSRAIKKARPARPPPLEGAEEPLREAARALLLHAGGLEAARAAAGAVRRLDQRKGSESDRTLREEYAAGQLYLVEVGEQPILDAAAEAAPVGHLFTDMKDFTRRTSDLKEAITAEFLRTAFYGPILGIAREYFSGLTQLSDRGGVYLNNLLGDAVSLSGDMESLVSIARKIREHLRAYQGDIERRLGAFDKETRSRAELAAGTFIAYGAPPSVVTFDDDVWGSVRVSIAEKINESARGCARGGAVLEAVETELTYLRRIQENPRLELPFSVYVRRSDGLPLEPAQSLALSRARRAGDRERYLEIYRIAAEKQAEESFGPEANPVPPTSTEMEARVGHLYNAGEAMSGEALEAFREQVADRGRSCEAMVEVSQLEPALLSRYAFLEPVLRLCLVTDGGGQPLLFRQAGYVRFKGLEAGSPTEIWEIIDLGSEAGKALFASPRVQQALSP